MSLYNLLFGENKDAVALLGMIKCNKEMFGRYRDAYLNPEGTIITVLTRVGGGNRKDYKEVFENIRNNEYFIRDYDDVFDHSYCYFDFSVPENYKETCKMIAPKKEVLNVTDKFKKEIEEADDPNSPAAKRMKDIGEQIIKQIDDSNSDINIIGL